MTGRQSLIRGSIVLGLFMGGHASAAPLASGDTSRVDYGGAAIAGPAVVLVAKRSEGATSPIRSRRAATVLAAADAPVYKVRDPSASSAKPVRPTAARAENRAGTGTMVGQRRSMRLGERPTPAQIREVRQDFPRANPDFRKQPASPRGDLDPEDEPARRTTPSTGDTDMKTARIARATVDFSVFRSTVAATGTSPVAEPTAANDRNGILATGNWYTALSGDNGLTWTSLNPFADPISGGFCCDQVAYAVDRGASSLVFWLRQYKYQASDRQNALRLSLSRGRDDLLDGTASCDWRFWPQDDFDLDSGYWFDYNRVSSTNEFLYITTNVRDADKDDKRVGALIFRIGLDDIDDGNCQITFRYWFEDGHPYIAPVQNAGSTMYLATHVHDLFEGDQLRIYSAADSSTKLEHKDKDIKNFASKDKDRFCTVPGGGNPCDRLHPDQVTGFRSDDTVGWLWTAPQDGEFPFPQVRVAVFETGTLKKIVEHEIHSDDFAWTLPAVGVNARGDLGVIVYAMGGGRFPNAQAFIRTNPRDWSGIQMNALVDSDSSEASDPDKWGDYASVRPYGNCTNTFLGMVWSIQGGQAENQAVWFGQPKDGCADLAVSALAALPARLGRGEALSVTQITRNIGSAWGGPSTTRYYLSRDSAKSGDDILLGAETTVPSLPPDGSVTGPVATATIPSSASGAYRLVACADDRAAVSEVTDTNNCFSGIQTITVEVP